MKPDELKTLALELAAALPPCYCSTCEKEIGGNSTVSVETANQNGNDGGVELQLTERTFSQNYIGEQWAKTDLPHGAKIQLARTERAVTGVRVISDLLMRDRHNSDDADRNEGVSYKPLEERDWDGLATALEFLIEDVENTLCDIREHHTSAAE